MEQSRPNDFSKKEAFDKIGEVISSYIHNVIGIKLDTFYCENHNFHEYIVVTFVGGAISVRNANINSLTINLYEVCKLLNGGYYEEVKRYKELKGLDCVK